MRDSKTTSARDVAQSIAKVGKDLASMFDNRAKTRAGQQNAAVVCVDRILEDGAEIVRKSDGRTVARIPVEIVLPADFSKAQMRSLRFVAFGALTRNRGE